MIARLYFNIELFCAEGANPASFPCSFKEA